MSVQNIHPAISALNTQSTSNIIQDVLGAVAKSSPDPIILEQNLRAIATRVGTSLKSVRQTYDMVLKNLNIKPVDLGLSICKELLETKYSNGAYLRQAAGGGLFAYQKTHWVQVTDISIKSELQTIAIKYKGLTDKTLYALVSDAMGCLKDYLGGSQDVLSLTEEPASVINCRNGELWFEANGQVELRPHRPETQALYCLPYDYSPQATCPVYDKTMMEIFENATNPTDMVRHVNEFLGYAIQPHRPIPVFWLFIGHGANGKTKFLQTACRLISADFIHNVDMASFDRDRFSVSQLPGKLLMIDDDIKMDTVMPDGLLKKISEAKILSARQPYGRSSFTFLCSALPVMVGNHYPTCNDLSHGLARRAMVVPFQRQFLGKEQDPSKFTTIWENEMSGVLNRAIEGYQRIVKRKKFLPPVDCIDAVKDFLAHGNPLYAFLKECLSEDESSRISLQEFRNAYSIWAKSQSVARLSILNKTLKRRLQALGYEISVYDGYHCIIGYNLIPDS